MTIVLFLIILGALIFVHELGHFISAKLSGIRVDEFALGFPPKIFSKKVGETIYSLNIIPFGGFVKIFGEDEENTPVLERSENNNGIGDFERRFSVKPRWVQAIVLSSGVVGNMIFAWVLLSIVFLLGTPSSLSGRYADNVSGATITITSVLKDSPAGRAGLIAGDKILMLKDGSRVFESRNSEDARNFIDESVGPISVRYERSGEISDISLSAEAGIIENRQVIGVTLDTIGVVKFGLFRSFFEGALMTFDIARAVVVGLFGFVVQVFHGEADLSAITGPVGIVGLVGEARVLGLVYLLSFTAFISVNLAVINLLPIPALDGGRILFVFIEVIMRRSIKPIVANMINTIGFFLLILLMIIITYRDIVNLFVK